MDWKCWKQKLLTVPIICAQNAAILVVILINWLIRNVFQPMLVSLVSVLGLQQSFYDISMVYGNQSFLIICNFHGQLLTTNPLRWFRLARMKAERWSYGWISWSLGFWAKMTWTTSAICLPRHFVRCQRNQSDLSLLLAALRIVAVACVTSWGGL